MGRHNRHNQAPDYQPRSVEEITRSVQGLPAQEQAPRKGRRFERVNRRLVASLAAVAVLGGFGAAHTKEIGAGLGKLGDLMSNGVELTPEQAKAGAEASSRLTSKVLKVENTLAADPTVTRLETPNYLALQNIQGGEYTHSSKTFTARLETGDDDQKVVQVRYDSGIGHNLPSEQKLNSGEGVELSYPTNASTVQEALNGLAARPDTRPTLIHGVAGSGYGGGSVNYELDNTSTGAERVNNTYARGGQEESAEQYVEDLDSINRMLDNDVKS